MNQKDLKFMMAYAECYGIKSIVECYAQVCKYVNACTEYYDITDEQVINEFMEAYNIIKITGFDAECFSLMRGEHYTIWQAIEDWDLPTTVEKAKQWMYEEICKEEWEDTLNSLYWDRF